MKLRRLKLCDADRMLEWMHDSSVVEYLQADFKDKTINDCYNFIKNSYSDSCIHMAITDDNDLYMGTVSLKNITKDAAEFAITVHRDAMGKGYAIWAMKKMIDNGFTKLNLKSIYWCVSQSNHRALRFYDKNGYSRTDACEINVIGYFKEQINSYIWYHVLNN